MWGTHLVWLGWELCKQPEQSLWLIQFPCNLRVSSEVYNERTWKKLGEVGQLQNFTGNRKEHLILKCVELPCADINDAHVWRWMLSTLRRPPELNRTQSQTRQTPKALNERFVNMLISNWKKSLFKRWKPEEKGNVDRKIINHGNSIMNQNNRCNMNNSILYKQKLDCSVSLFGKANMPKINFPESLINVLRSVLTSCYKKPKCGWFISQKSHSPQTTFSWWSWH